MGVHPSCGFQAKPLTGFVLDAKPRLHPRTSQRAVVLQTHAGLHNPRSALDGVVDVASKFRGVFLLFNSDLQRIEGLEVGLHADHLNAILHIVFTQHVFEVKSKVEALHLAETVWGSHFIEVDSVVAQGKVTVQEHGTSWGHHREGSATADIAPAVVRKVHARAVIQDTCVVVEIESEDTQLGTVAPAKSDFPERICETKGQPSVVDVGIEQLGSLIEVAVLDAQQVADAARTVLRHLAKRSVHEQLGPKRTGTHAALGLAHVAIACANVHDAANPSAVFG